MEIFHDFGTYFLQKLNKKFTLLNDGYESYMLTLNIQTLSSLVKVVKVYD